MGSASHRQNEDRRGHHSGEEGLGPAGASRRDFLRACSLAAAAVGLPASMVPRMAEAVTKAAKPSVIWLHFQECTGCTESLLRTSRPAVADLILNLISLDYHETLLAAAGAQAEAVLEKTRKANKGKYVCVIEGAIPMKDRGVYCKVGGRTAVESAREIAKDAAAVVTIGSCASWGGIASTGPNPTGATGAPEVLKDLLAAGKPLVTIPGCPANPYNLLGTLLQFVTMGTLPELDAERRPKWAYGRTIHEHCPRRAHFEAGRLALQFGDEDHRAGHCLYMLGCKGPVTHANCPVNHFSEVPDAWPIGIGHPCVGCTEREIAFTLPLHDLAPIESAHAADAGACAGAAAPVSKPRALGIPVATGVVGAVAGAFSVYGVMRSKRGGQGAPPEGGTSQ